MATFRRYGSVSVYLLNAVGMVIGVVALTYGCASDWLTLVKLLLALSVAFAGGVTFGEILKNLPMPSLTKSYEHKQNQQQPANKPNPAPVPAGK